MMLARFQPDKMRKEILDRFGSQVAFCRATGMDQAHVSRILSGEYKPKTFIIARMAKALGKPAEYFLYPGDVLAVAERPTDYRARKIPIIARVSAGGKNVNIFTDGADSTPLGVGVLGSVSFPLSDELAFALEIDGDSMEPGYPHGTRVVVSPRLGFRQGMIHCVQLTDMRAYVKRVRHHQQIYALESLNPAYKTIYVDEKNIRIVDGRPAIWRVIWLQLPR